MKQHAFRKIYIEVVMLGQEFEKQFHDDLGLPVLALTDDTSQILIHDDEGNVVNTIDLSPMQAVVDEWWEVFNDNYLDWDLSSFDFVQEDKEKGDKAAQEFFARSGMAYEKVKPLVEKLAAFIYSHLPAGIVLYYEGEIYKPNK